MQENEVNGLKRQRERDLSKNFVADADEIMYRSRLSAGERESDIFRAAL